MHCFEKGLQPNHHHHHPLGRNWDTPSHHIHPPDWCTSLVGGSESAFSCFFSSLFLGVSSCVFQKHPKKSTWLAVCLSRKRACRLLRKKHSQAPESIPCDSRKSALTIQGRVCAPEAAGFKGMRQPMCPPLEGLELETLNVCPWKQGRY